MPIEWHVQVFRLPAQRRRGIFQSKRESAGYGWSASGSPEGYRYSKGPYEDPETAETAARAVLEDEDSVVTSVGISVR